jgi:hypothetical protein
MLLDMLFNCPEKLYSLFALEYFSRVMRSSCSILLIYLYLCLRRIAAVVGVFKNKCAFATKGPPTTYSNPKRKRVDNTLNPVREYSFLIPTTV